MHTGYGGYGFLILIVLFFWIILGGGFGGGFMNRGCNCDATTNCQVERQGLITAAETNYRIIDENRRSTDLISGQLNRQWDAAQGEKIFDLKLNALAMQQSFESKLLAKDATIERMTLAATMDKKFDALTAAIADIRCNMLSRPPVFGIGTSCNSIVTPALFGNGCGCNGLV